MDQATGILNAPRHRTRLAGGQIRNDRIELSFLPEFGCHWTRLRLSVKGEWVDLLMPVADGDVLLDAPTGHGSYILAPWSNRIPRGVFRFDGRNYRVEPNSGDGSAIHGDVRLRPWTVLRSTATRFEASLSTVDFEDFNYPFSLHFHHVLQLEEDHLHVRMTTTNVDSVRTPVGLGYHPHLLRRPTWRDEDVLLIVAAKSFYPLENALPTGLAVPVDGRNDLRPMQRLGDRHVDTVYTDLTDNQVRVIYPGSRVEVRLEFDQDFSHVLVHAPGGNGATPPPYVAVELLTHVINAFNLYEEGWTNTGVKILEPGEHWTTSWSLSVGDI